MLWHMGATRGSTGFGQEAEEEGEMGLIVVSVGRNKQRRVSRLRTGELKSCLRALGGGAVPSHRYLGPDEQGRWVMACSVAA